MTMEIDSALPETKEQVIEWINKSIDPSLPGNLQDITNEVILKIIAKVEQLQWQLQHGCMQLAVSYENTLRKYTNLLPDIHQKLRDVQLGRGKGGELVTEWEDFLEVAQTFMSELTSKLAEAEMMKIRELLEQKSSIEKQLKSQRLVQEWEEKVECVRNALRSKDIDAAEEGLRDVDNVFEEHWQDDLNKTIILRELRNELVQLINEE